MDSFECYKLYLSLKLHFTKESYNYFKSRTSNATLKSFVKRRDYHFFVKLSSKYTQEQLIDFFVSQFLVNLNFWIGDSFNTECTNNYLDYIKTKSTLTRQIESDLNFLYTTYSQSELYSAKRGYPKIISAYLQGKVRIETLVLLDIHTSWSIKIDILEGIVWVPMKQLISKYRPFLYHYDMSKFVGIYESALITGEMLRKD